jgi:hypothetical protein
MSIFDEEVFPPEADYRARFNQMIDAQFYGSKLDSETRRALSELAERGAEELSRTIIRQGATGRSRELYVQKAEANLESILQLIERQRRDKDEKTVSFETFNVAMRGICPLWPFC